MQITIENNGNVKKKYHTNTKSKMPIHSMQFYFTNVHNLKLINCSEKTFLLEGLNNSMLK